MRAMGFDEVALAYDSSIDWEARLSREIPFMIESTGSIDQKRVLDLACGTGRHAIVLSKLGATVVGIDSSETMINQARKLAAEEHADVKFLIADMKEMHVLLRNKFDLVICLGNSLALLSNLDSLKEVISDIRDILVPGGRFIAQILNFEEILNSRFRYMPPKSGRTVDGNEIVFFRFFSHADESEVSTLILSAFERRGAEWEVTMRSMDVLQLNHDIIGSMMTAAGFTRFRYYSSYEGVPFNSRRDRNLIAVAIK